MFSVGSALHPPRSASISYLLMPPKRKLSGSFTRKQTRRSRRSTFADSESAPPNDQLPIESEPTSAPNTPPNVTGDILAANALNHNDIEDASFVAALQQSADNAVQTPSQTELQATLLEDRRLANSISRKAGQAGRITWTLHMTEVLVDATLTHVRNNTRAYSNGFGDIAWDDVAKRIQTECGPAAGGVNAEKARDKVDNVSLLYLLSRGRCLMKCQDEEKVQYLGVAAASTGLGCGSGNGVAGGGRFGLGGGDCGKSGGEDVKEAAVAVLLAVARDLYWPERAG